MNIEQTLKRIENKLDRLLTIQQSKWISEAEAMKCLGRSEKWLQRQRLGTKEFSPSLIEGHDWRRIINGRTIEYKRSAIEELKRYVPPKQGSDTQGQNTELDIT
jgi:hypothetical protein